MSPNFSGAGLVRNTGLRSRRSPVPALLITALLAVGLAAGCDTAKVLAPPPPLRAVSASLYAVDVEFPVPLDKASAEDPANYVIYPESAPGAIASISSATLIDTAAFQMVQLIVPAWFGDSATDRRATVVETHGVLDYFGRSTENRRARFVTGLGYSEPMRGFFDSKCSSCHGPTNPGGSYRTDSYAALFGPGTSATPNVIAGNPNCLLITKCKPGNSMYNRANLTFLDYETILNWVVVYQARE